MKTAAEQARQDKAMLYARLIQRAVETDLSEADYFTREDLLQLRILQHVATISRYTHVRIAVHILLNSQKIVELSRTQFCLPGRVHKAKRPPPVDEYRNRVSVLSRRQPGDFTVMDIVDGWRTDNHLTPNAKRVVVREALAHFVKEGLIQNKKNELTFKCVRQRGKT